MGNAKPTLSLMGFFMLTAAMVVSVHEYPTFASAGMQIPFFLLVCGFLWFLPLALCAAEMATVDGWENGGIFSWVGGMLGEKYGFAALFFQWFQITVCFVTIIYFFLSSFSYTVGFPTLVSNPLLQFIGVMVVFWGLTLVQFGGTKITDLLAKYCWFIGVGATTLLLLALMVVYLAKGQPVHFDVSAKNLLPDFAQLSTLVVFVNFIFANTGAEASASHINEMKNPRRDYPLAMLLLVVLSTVLNAIGGFTVATVVPLKDLSMAGGMVQTFEKLLLTVNSGLGWAARAVGLMLVVGVVGEVSSWVVGPARAMYTACQRGLLPKGLQRLNKNNVPTRLVVVQGVVVSIWAAVLTFGGGGDNLSYLVSIALTTVIYMVGYILLFVSYLKLMRRPDLKRDFHVPGGRAGKLFFALSGLSTSAFALFIAFFPPATLAAGQGGLYVALLAASFGVTVLLPFLIYALYGKKHSDPAAKPTHLLAKEVNRFARLPGRGEHKF